VKQLSVAGCLPHFRATRGKQVSALGLEALGRDDHFEEALACSDSTEVEIAKRLTAL
jgi:hypothetical protein